MDISSDNDSTQAETVQERRLKWMLNADKALAEQLQTKEFKKHYKHNKEKNAQLREDLSRAKNLAQEIDEDRNLQIEIDRRMAKELSKELSAGVAIETLLQERRDEELARNMQKFEITNKVESNE